MNKNKAPKKYWFSLETYVHISIKKDSLLLYNPLTGKILQYDGEKRIVNLVKKMQKPGNLQVIPLTGADLQDPALARFVNETRAHFMGELIDADLSRGKPVQMMPILTVKKNVKYMKNAAHRSVGEDMMQYLAEIFLYINNTCQHNCPHCAAAYKQFPCCTLKANKTGEMNIAAIETLLQELAGTSLISINILGGDIFAHTGFKPLAEMLNNHPAQKKFHTHYLNVISDQARDRLQLLDPGSNALKILAPAPIRQEKLKTALQIVKSGGIPAAFIFIIQNEAEFEQAEALIESLQIADHDFKPLFNGQNLEFFKENIFLDLDEILGVLPASKEIYQNSLVNSLNFGRLTVFHDGHIYANVNASRLGILGKDSIYDVLFKEMQHGKSWRRIRKNVQPCKSCTLEALCPPLSNYNHALGRNDLCHKYQP